MKHGFVKIAAISPELRVADVEFNASKIIEAIGRETRDGTEIIVFPELCLCGYTVGDILFQSVLSDGCLRALKKIAESTRGRKALVFVGLPFTWRNGLYNCAAAICDGRVLAIVPKSNLPTYAEFSDKRWFSPAPEGHYTVSLWDDESAIFTTNCLISDIKEKEVKVACEICEDLWVNDSPAIRHASAGATVIVNLSASTELLGKADSRRTLMKAQSSKSRCVYVYANAGSGESTTDVVFSGHSLIAENGVIIAENKPFDGKTVVAEADISFLDYERKRTGAPSNPSGYEEIEAEFVGDGELSMRKISRTPFVSENGKAREENAELTLTIQATGLAKRLAHTKAKTAVIGVSGGLDSSLALTVTARAFELLGKDRKEIVAVTMPGFGTTGTTYQNAIKLIEGVGATFREVNIAKTVLSHFEDISHDKTLTDTTYENAQARMRTMILMDIANQTNGLVVGTGDLSELALGWCTYNGDQMSMYGVNSSVPKTLVKVLVAYEAERLGGTLGEALLSVVQTEISPELLPPDQQGKIVQKTEDIVGPYELHDFYLYYALGRGYRPEKLYAVAKYAFGNTYDGETLKKWLKNFYRRFFTQQFKRSASPDGVKIGSISLSPRGDWHMPSDAVAKLWLDEADRL